MSALDGTCYTQYARERIAEAQQAVDRHAVCAYTGVCLGCGRPGPCGDLIDAQQTLARWLHLVHQGRPADQPEREATEPNEALHLATGAAEPLRAACLTVETAFGRCATHLDGVTHPLPRAALTNWDSALTAAWQALSLVHAGIAEARRLPGASPASIADVLDGLRAARADAVRAAADATRLRHQLATAEDRLRHADAGPRTRAAAERWRTAVARLDLVCARLAVGTRAIDRYAAALAGAAPPPRPLGYPGASTPGTARETAAGAKTAGAVLLAVHPWRGRRGFWARVHRETRREWRWSRPC